MAVQGECLLLANPIKSSDEDMLPIKVTIVNLIVYGHDKFVLPSIRAGLSIGPTGEEHRPEGAEAAHEEGSSSAQAWSDVL
jgi:hypothetical protein